MELREDRTFLNQFSIWGLKQHDPGNTLHIKSTNPNHSLNSYREHRVLFVKPNSRYLSSSPSDYLL